jgi:hypothetical protein
MIALVSPVVLMLGAGLFAVGALSFLDIHFFEKRLTERAALAGGLSLIVLAELIFASSDMSTRFLNGQRSDVLECRLDAETALPEERHKDSAGRPSDRSMAMGPCSFMRSRKGSSIRGGWSRSA